MPGDTSQSGGDRVPLTMVFGDQRVPISKWVEVEARLVLGGVAHARAQGYGHEPLSVGVEVRL